MIGFGTLGIVALQAMAAFAVVAFFARRGAGRRFSTGVAPLLGGLGLTAAVVLVATDFRLLTNSDAWALDALPALYGVVVVGGAGYAAWLRRHRPEVFDAVAGPAVREALAATPEPES